MPEPKSLDCAATVASIREVTLHWAERHAGAKIEVGRARSDRSEAFADMLAMRARNPEGNFVLKSTVRTIERYKFKNSV